MSEAEMWKKYWKTSVSRIDGRNCDVIIRGYKLSEIIDSLTYSETLFLVIRGRLPSLDEKATFEAVLCSIPDYGLGPAPLASRTVAAANPEIIPAIIGGLLAAGSRFYSPQDCAKMLLSGVAQMKALRIGVQEVASTIVAEYKANNKRVPGYGHPEYKYKDLRAVGIRKTAERHLISSEYTELLEAIHSELRKSPKLESIPINVDGMIAATMLDMGFNPLSIAGVACISFIPGLIAHAIEEITYGPGIREIPEFMQEYTGETGKKLVERD